MALEGRNGLARFWFTGLLILAQVWRLCDAQGGELFTGRRRTLIYCKIWLAFRFSTTLTSISATRATVFTGTVVFSRSFMRAWQRITISVYWVLFFLGPVYHLPIFDALYTSILQSSREDIRSALKLSHALSPHQGDDAFMSSCRSFHRISYPNTVRRNSSSCILSSVPPSPRSLAYATCTSAVLEGNTMVRNSGRTHPPISLKHNPLPNPLPHLTDQQSPLLRHPKKTHVFLKQPRPMRRKEHQRPCIPRPPQCRLHRLDKLPMLRVIEQQIRQYQHVEASAALLDFFPLLPGSGVEMRQQRTRVSAPQIPLRHGRPTRRNPCSGGGDVVA